MNSQKTAIVTGGSRGIGAAISERLAADGFVVIVGYNSNQTEAEFVVETIKGKGGKAIAFGGDVADSTNIEKMFDWALTEHGGVDVIVNNAGIMRLSTIGKMDDATFDAHISANIKGTFNGMREAARRLREGGRVINISSSVVRMRRETYGVYAATKAAVETMTAVAAKEMRGRNITVNAIAPGPTATALFLEGKPQELVDQLKMQAPLERLGEPTDIAAVASFLASPDGAWVNGQTIYANGGLI